MDTTAELKERKAGGSIALNLSTWSWLAEKARAEELPVSGLVQRIIEEARAKEAE